jgi:hypothetical protein
MADDGLGPVELDGRWVGFYRHRWEELGAFPITAEIRQDGDRIAGEMYDQITDRSNFLEELLEVTRADISPSNRSRLERVISQFGTEAVVVNSRLPDTADLDGTIAGNRVEFTKSYRGSFTYNWVVGQQEIVSGERHGHKVYYSGHLDPEKGLIAGEWTIRRPGLLGRLLPPRDWGTFELYHKA